MQSTLRRLSIALDGHLDMLRPAVVVAEPLSPDRVDVVAELGGNHDLAAERLQGLADQFLIGERGAIALRGIEEGDAPLDGRTDEPDHRVAVRLHAVATGHGHAAETDGRHFEAGPSKFALLHGEGPFRLHSSNAVLARLAVLSA